jgi:sarcosine oxidase gamma subunit
LNFQLLEKLSTVSRAGHQESRVEGVLGSMSVQSSIRRAENDASVIAAEVQISVVTPNGRRTGLKALTELAPGELLVIGQSDIAASPRTGPAQLYYVVRATP